MAHGEGTCAPMSILSSPYITSSRKFWWARSPGESYMFLAIRLYHVWCMLIGLFMIIACILQVFLAAFEEFFAYTWLVEQTTPGLALMASVFVAILALDVATSLCSAAVWLMIDAWHADPFVDFRSLLLFEPVSARLGVPFQQPERNYPRRADRIVQVLLYVAIDVVPVIAAVVSGDASQWMLWLAFMSLLMVVAFWIVDVIHDYAYKVRGLQDLFRCPQAGDEALSAVDENTIVTSGAILPPEEPDAEDMLADARGVSCCHPTLKNRERALRACGFALVAIVVWCVFFFVHGSILLVAALVSTLMTAIELLQLRIERMLSLIKIRPRTQEDRLALSACIGDNLCLTTACTRNEWSLPSGAQLVSDGFINADNVGQHLLHYPDGTELTFRKWPLSKSSVFLEVYCGSSPEQLAMNSIFILCWFCVSCAVMIKFKCFKIAVACFVGLLVYLSPCVCLFLAPRLAAKFNLSVNLIISSLSLVIGLSASHPSSSIFWLTIVLFISSHGLLRRRLQYNVIIGGFVALISVVGITIFFFLSVATAFEPPIVPDFQPSAANFSFPRHGSRSGYHPASNLATYVDAAGFGESPACSLRYPTSNASNPLDIVDFVFFNKAVYEPNGTLQSQISSWLGDWQLVHQVRREDKCKDRRACSIQDWSSWFVFEGRKGTGLENTTVVTIRGTKTPLDMLFDLDLWSLEVLGVQTLASHFPGIDSVVNGFWNSPKAGAIYYKWKRDRYRGVREYLQDRTVAEPHRIFYLSGHSLGGGIAALLVGELTHVRIPAVTFSPPGVKNTAAKLGIDSERLEGLVVDVIPKRDPVPAGCGPHAGISMNIPCIAEPDLACHRVFNTACELMRECGDRRQRILPCSFCPAQAKLMGCPSQSLAHASHQTIITS